MFPGFSEDAMKFLRQLKRNNKREWFQPRKDVYERELKQPMEQLVEEINSALAGFAPEYMNEPKRAIFRIYRDTRFSNDKTPYKTHIAAWFGRQAVECKTAGGFYFHVEPESVHIAGGVYMPPREQLLALRTFLLDNHEEFRKRASGRKLRSLMGDMGGDTLTRDPKGFPKDHPASGLIRRKQWGWSANLPGNVATTPRLVKEIVKRLEAVAPAVDFLNQAFEMKKPKRGIYFD